MGNKIAGILLLFSIFLLAGSAAEGADARRGRERLLSQAAKARERLGKIIEKRRGKVRGAPWLKGNPVKGSPAAGTEAAQAPSADAAFKLGDAFGYPNPAVAGQNPTLHMECGIADSLEVKIYDVSGNLVHQAKVEQQPQVVGGKYAYEYSWDASGAASGVYACVMVARKSGEADIKVTKKLAVVR